WSVPFITAEVTARQGDWEGARAGFREAIQALESVRASLKTPAQQRQWAADKTRVYQRATEVAIIASDGVAAIEFGEGSRARFLQAIQYRHAQRPAGVTEEAWLRYERSSDRLAQARGRRRAGLVQVAPALDQQVRDAEAEFSRAVAAVQSVGSVVLDKPPVSLSEWRDLANVIPPGYTAVFLGVYPSGLGIICASRDTAGEPWTKAKLFPEFTSDDLSHLI